MEDKGDRRLVQNETAGLISSGYGCVDILF